MSAVTTRTLWYASLVTAISSVLSTPLALARPSDGALKRVAAAPVKAATLQQIVVTATAVGVKQLDAGYNVNTASRDQIEEMNPLNVGDLLQMVSPGTWSANNAGKSSGATIVAGYPSTHGAPFSTVMVNGTPLYGAAQLSYMDTSTLMRLDDTISRVESVQGGTGAIFGPGEIGSTANFLLRTGSAVPSGDIGLTYGFEGRERLDGFYGFPLKAKGWYASIGGFYRVSDGIRDPQYKADKGGQFTATLKHITAHSRLLLWARVLNDKNLFMKQIPIIQEPDGRIRAYPGFNPLTGAYYSRAIQYSDVPSPLGGFQGANMANGRGADMHFFGGSYDATVGSWTLSDHVLYSGGHLPTTALFPGSNPEPLSAYVYGCDVPEPAGYCVGGKPVDTHTLSYPSDRAIIATLPDGQAVPLGQSVIQQGLTFDYKDLKSLVNDFRASKELFDGNTLTAGVYLARYTAHDNNSSGNQMLLLNRPNSLPIGLTYAADGQTFIQSNEQGLVNLNSASVFLLAGAATNKALYLSDTWKLGGWTLVAGARVENQDARERSCNTSPVDLDGNPLTVYDNRVKICNGTWNFEHYNKTHPSFAASANYQFNSHTSAYVNASVGGHFDDFSNGIQNADGDFAPMLKVKDMEAGFRYQTDQWFLDLNLYHRLFTGIQYQETDANGTPIPGAISTYGSNAHGVNVLARWSPIPNLSFTLLGNYVDGRYAHDHACQKGFSIDGVAECLSFDGNPLASQPEVHYMFTPRYTLPTAWGNVTGWITYDHVGQEYADQTGLQPLGTFNTLAAGVVADIGPSWQFRLQGTNLTNAIGITEGNTRVLGVSSGVNGVIMVKPLFGREVFVQAKYRF